MQLWQFPVVFNFAGILQVDERDMDTSALRAVRIQTLWGKSHCTDLVFAAPRDSSDLVRVTTVCYLLLCY